MHRWLGALGALCTALSLSACHGTGGSSSSGSASSGAAKPDVIVTKSGVEMAVIPAGKFTMGSDQGNPDEAPPHSVSVSQFLMDAVPVTGEMYGKAQMGNPSHWYDSPKLPVEKVRWRDAKTYCNERSRLEGLSPCYNEKTAEWDCNYAANGYRLPTEAEWEYAARAGSETPYDFGGPDQL